MTGRTLGGATTSLMQGMIVVAICFLVGFRVTDWSMLPLAFVFMMLIAVMFTALGTGIACVLSDFQGFQLIMNFLVMPIFFLSGALFPLNNVPRALEIVAALDPLTYGVDGLRAALGGGEHFGIAMDLGVLAVLTMAFLGLGSWLFSRIEA